MSELIIIEEEQQPTLFQGNALEQILQEIERKARDFTPDVTTDKGRKEIASQAHKVTRSKTYIDRFAKDQKAVITEQQKAMKERLDNLRDEIRAPLDAWEETEKPRIDAHKAAIKEMEELGVFGFDATAADLRQRMDLLGEKAGRTWEEFQEKAQAVWQDVSTRIQEAMVAAEKREAEQAELERLRQAELERQKAAAEAEQKAQESVVEKPPAQAPKAPGDEPGQGRLPIRQEAEPDLGEDVPPGEIQIFGSDITGGRAEILTAPAKDHPGPMLPMQAFDAAYGLIDMGNDTPMTAGEVQLFEDWLANYLAVGLENSNPNFSIITVHRDDENHTFDLKDLTKLLGLARIGLDIVNQQTEDAKRAAAGE